MFCTQCGKEAPDGACFCAFCGSALPAPPPQKPCCPACGRELDQPTAFCIYCGARTELPQPAAQPQEAFAQQASYQQQAAFTQQPSRQTPGADTQSNQFGGRLKSVEGISWLAGDPKVGIPKATGCLDVYRDRLELEISRGSNGWMALGLVGYAISRSQGKKQPPLIFPMDQIASAHESSYLKARSIVIQLKSGETHTLSGSFSEQDVQECLQIIQTNAR